MNQRMDMDFLVAISGETAVAPSATPAQPTVPATCVKTSGVSPGSYWADMDIVEYHTRAPGVSSSRLKHILVSPAHYQIKLSRPMLETDALRIGRMLHTTVLEPHLLASEFAIWTQGRRQGQEWEIFKLLNQDRTIITNDQRECVEGMSEAMYQIDDFPFEGWLHGVGHIPAAVKERSIFWIDEETGLECRARPDAMTLGESPLAGDVKSTRSADPDQFVRDIFNMRYDLQAAHYVAGIKAVFGVDAKFVFFAAEKEAPHVARSFLMSPDSLAHGERYRRYCLRMIKKCTDEGIWPKQPVGAKAILVEPPFMKDKDLLDLAAAYGLR